MTRRPACVVASSFAAVPWTSPGARTGAHLARKVPRRLAKGREPREARGHCGKWNFICRGEPLGQVLAHACHGERKPNRERDARACRHAHEAAATSVGHRGRAQHATTSVKAQTSGLVGRRQHRRHWCGRAPDSCPQRLVRRGWRTCGLPAAPFPMWMRLRLHEKG